jgi:hypothetical protein
MKVFSHIAKKICKFKPNFELGGDLTAEEGKQKMCIGDMLTDDDTFKIITDSMEEVTKMKALRVPDISEACFGNEERTNRAMAKRKEEEKMKANKKPIDKEEFDKEVSELLQTSDGGETNTKNGGSSGEKDQDHFGNTLQRHSNLQTTLCPWDLLATNRCSRNFIQQQQLT